MDDNKTDWFADVAIVVAEPVKFKLQLAIGEDAYTSLRVKKAVFDTLDTVGAASTAATVAKSSLIANMFFQPTGLLSLIGFGTATTPIGWVVGAAIVAGGASIGITRYLRVQTEARAKTIPEFINTPIDVIGLALFDLMAPLALKVADVDGVIDPSEREKIEHWFVRQWGYDPIFVCKGLSFFSTRLNDIQIADIAANLARYKQENPDCNSRAINKEVLRFLKEIMEADGVIDEREEMAIERVARAFEREGGMQLGRKISSSVTTLGNAISERVSDVFGQTVSSSSSLGRAASDVLSDTLNRGVAGMSAMKAKVTKQNRSD